MDTKFIGIVDVYDKKVFLDLNTGAGVSDVVGMMRWIVLRYKNRLRLPYYDSADIQQLLNCYIIEGIHKYNLHFNTKLSTFLHIYLKNRICSVIKHNNKKAKIAYCYDNIYSITCKYCKFMFTDTLNNINAYKFCKECNCYISQDLKPRITRFEPIPFSKLSSYCNGEIHNFENDNKSRTSNTIDFSDNSITIDRIDDYLDFVKILSQFDEKTKRILNLLYFSDSSLDEIAKKVGMTGWAVTLKIRKLRNNNSIRDFFNR